MRRSTHSLRDSTSSSKNSRSPVGAILVVSACTRSGIPSARSLGGALRPRASRIFSVYATNVAIPHTI
ncbi:hypothetical protein BV20DRAFT_776642 [Pilatotrama ljubarskyi]|nr:hypothetical protein BV20DRAFT_776642 [Pilatotrama ljubarskyi]